MASIKFSALVSEMRGKLNGSVFSKNRSGNYLRNKVTPVNPQSTDQQAVRSLLSSVSQSWRQLTQAQRDAWINASANFPYTDIYGDSKILSGQAFYNKLNLNLLKISAAMITNPPSSSDLPSLSGVALTVTKSTGTSAVTVTADWTASDEPANAEVLISATPPVGAGISFVKNKFRDISVQAIGAGPANISAAYTGKFGTVEVGQKVFILLQVVDNETGLVSQPYQAYVIVTAVA
jgi:hypothetical protein